MAASGQGTTLVSGKGNYLLCLSPVGPLHLELAPPLSHPPESWLHTFYQLGHSIWQP